MQEYLSIIDFIIVLILFVILYLWGTRKRNSRIEKEPYYKYFVPALLLKALGGIAVCLVYIYYYGGGDTLAYYHDNTCISKLFLKNPVAAIQFTFLKPEDSMYYNFFDVDTDWPWYMFDNRASYVTKLTWILSFITFNSILGQTVLLAFLSFLAMWRLYKMFITEFPTLQRGLAFAILFIPSVIFWGSGLLKDTITLAAVGLFTSSFYQILKLKRKYLANIIFMIIASWALIRIKPYIFFALMPGVLVWFSRHQLSKMKNSLVRSALTPMLLIITIAVAFLFLLNMGDSLGAYSLDNIFEQAVITQQELKQDYYHGSSFDIGDFDATIGGIVGKIPIAIISTLFRPFLWESYNPAMITSGIENFIMLIFTSYLLLKLRVFNFFKLVFAHPLLFFSFSFSLFFAFSVGLTTSNFGAIVRYKIPAIPFFVASLIITNYFYQKKKNENEGIAAPVTGSIPD